MNLSDLRMTLKETFTPDTEKKAADILTTLIKLRSEMENQTAFATHARPTADITVDANGATGYTGLDATKILEQIRDSQRRIFEMDMKGVPDRNGNVHSFAGMQVHSSPLLPTTKQVAIKRERKWCHRLRFEKERQYDITYETRKVNEAYVVGGKLVVTEEQYRQIAGLDTSKTSIGFQMHDTSFRDHTLHFELPIFANRDIAKLKF